MTAGVPLKQSLATLARGGKRGRLATEALASVDRGSTLAEALAGASSTRVPPEHLALVEAGERSGKLDEMLAQIITDVEMVRELRSSIITRSLYPMMILALTVILPPLFLLITGRASEYFTIQLSVFGPIAVLFLLWHQRDRFLPRTSPMRGKLQQLLRMIPFLGTFAVEHSLSRSLSLLGLMLEAGLGFAESLPLVGRASGWIFLEHEFNAAEEKIRQGATASEGLCALSRLPVTLHSTISSGEVSGTLDQALKKCGEELRERSTTRMDRFLVVLPIAAVLVVGLVVGIIVVRFFLNAYSGF
jgi:type II secretory pathway component PulF